MIYLDNSATTRPRSEVTEAVRNAMEEGWFNPSSVYRPSMDVQKGMEDVRKACLAAVHARNGKVIFTSGGTEADNLALMGSLKRTRKTGKILLFSLDHPAVLACAEEMTRMGHQVLRIPCDARGIADLAKLEEMMDPEVLLISVMQVNNEVGSVQPLNRIMVSVPKRNFKRAVKRNLLKRRLREAYRLQKDMLEGTGRDILFFYSSNEIVDSAQIRAEVASILKNVSAK